MATLLIVDDQQLNIQTLVAGLSSTNFTIYSTTRATQTLMMAEELQPDLILLDVMMPELNGFEVCKRLKTSPTTADIPVIFVTALYEQVDKLRGLEVGGEDYITKPYAVDEVAARIRVHLALREKRLEVEKLRRQDLAYFERLNQIRDEILDQMKHDLKSPLSSIKISLHLITRLCGSADPSVIRHISRADAAVNEISHVIETLVEIAKLETGRSTQFRYVEILPLVQQAVQLFETSAEAKNITLKLHQENLKLKQTVYVDPDQIASVLRNLIGNAIKYTEAGGHVTVTSQFESNVLQLEVTDTGHGIAQENLGRIFQRMYRIPSEQDIVEGTGLGLYIVKSIVDSHGGEIRVASEVGRGSTFTVLFPQPEPAGV